MLPTFRAFFKKTFAAFAFIAATFVVSSAQSTDVTRPTPLFNGELSGRIAPRDVGDARLTRHFYVFTGREGDLFLTVESNELNGDIDIFTASTLRPLLKVTVFPTFSGYFVKKSIYLRVEEPLILRVEGKAVADNDARYRIKLEGAFGPATGAYARVEETAPADTTETASETRGGRRTTATGQRLPEPVTETAAQPTPTPEATPEAERSNTEARTPNTRRGTRNTSRRNRPPARAETEAARETSGEGERPTEKPAEERSTEAEEAPAPRTTRTPSRRTGRGRTPARRTIETPAETATPRNTEEDTSAAESPAAGPRLVIVTKDGETIERDMKGVRRVTVERGVIVVVGMDGRVSRVPMSNVLRMSIEP